MDFETIFANNAVFSGGFGLAVIAGGAHFLRSSTRSAITLMKRHFLVTLEITSKDRSYPWVLQWLYARGNMTQHISVETSIRPSTSDTSNVKIDFVPGTGDTGIDLHIIIL